MSETKHTEAVLTVLHPPWGIPFSPVFVAAGGLEPPILTQYDGRIHQVGALCQLSYATK